MTPIGQVLAHHYFIILPIWLHVPVPLPAFSLFHHHLLSPYIPCHVLVLTSSLSCIHVVPLHLPVIYRCTFSVCTYSFRKTGTWVKYISRKFVCPAEVENLEYRKNRRFDKDWVTQTDWNREFKYTLTFHYLCLLILQSGHVLLLKKQK